MSPGATVRAKMVCSTIVENHGYEGPQYDAKFFPVTGGSGENEEFFKATPAGGLELNGLKSKFGLETGKEYYIDLIPVPEE